MKVVSRLMLQCGTGTDGHAGIKVLNSGGLFNGGRVTRCGGDRGLSKYDVSIILNLHNEARYFKRTMLSLEDAVRYARQFDITFEIVAVLDNADKETSSIVEAYDYSVFDAFQIIHVSNGSLGLSRNDGIEVACGEYIATADGDDLVSFNFFQSSYMTALSYGEKAIVFSEYNFAFGSEGFLWRYYDIDYVGNGAFFSSHPYLSRAFFHRSLPESIKYKDVSVRSGFAYEDWHFNCECLAAGYIFKVAKETILFYRQRAGSLLRQANSGASRIIPKSRYFDPDTFVKLLWSEFSGNRSPVMPVIPFTLEQFISFGWAIELVAAANKIDSAISLGILQHQHAGTNIVKDVRLAKAYFEVCQIMAGETFTDVVMVPFLARGGAEKYLLSIIHAMKEVSPKTKFLILSGQSFGAHEGLDRLPEDSLFIDLYGIGMPNLSAADISHVAFRLIQNLNDVERVHYKTSPFANDFIGAYTSKLPDLEHYYYYFSDHTETINNIKFVNGNVFNVVSDHGGCLSKIISDNSIVLDRLSQSIGNDIPAKSAVLYSECQVAYPRPVHKKPRFSILWASRIDPEKRPELVVKIARQLSKELAEVSIDVFGVSTFNREAVALFDGVPNLQYHGEFSRFDDLPTGRYDAFLYTTAFDGLPNVILEASAAGLPVIAPDIGGIPEMVSEDTGYLIEDDTDESILVERYVAAIKALYDDWPEALRRGENGRKLITERHSREAFLKRVAEVFALEQGSKPKLRRKSSRRTQAS